MLSLIAHPRLTACLVLLVTCGCAPVGPDHEVPEMTLPASFSQGGTTWRRQSPEHTPTPQKWWRLYHDAVLTDLIERALAGNQDLAAAAARLQQARETSKMVHSQFFPDINLNASTERSKFRFRGSGGGSIQTDSFAIPLELRYEIDTWGRVRRQVESANATEQAVSETHNAMRLSIAGEVAQTYWALRAVDANRAVLDQTLEIRRRALGLLEKRLAAGTLSSLDLARAETEVATATADRIKLDQDRVILVNALAVLGGSVATGSAIAPQVNLPVPPSVPRTVPMELLRQRPDIRAAERRVAAANADIGVAQAAFYPTLAINASTGVDAVSLGNLVDASALVWSVGANALVPITKQKLLRARRDAAIAAHQATSAEYRQTVLEAIREAENALQGSVILHQRQLAQEQALTAARKTFDLSSKRFQAGLVSFLDVVDAERTRLEAERLANVIRAERLALSVHLIKALGGEW